MAIAQKLAASDPGNSQWQRDLAISCLRVGSLEVAGLSVLERRNILQLGVGVVAQLRSENQSLASDEGLQLALERALAELGMR